MANEITVTVADASIPEIWIAEALRALYSEAKVAKKGVIHLELVDGKPGDKINFTEMGRMTVNTAGASGTVTNQATTQTNRPVSLDQWKEVTWRVAERVMSQSILNYQSEFNAGSMSALAEYMDASILDDYGSITTYSQGSTSNPGAMSKELAIAAKADLDGGRVKSTNRSWLFHPKDYGELLKVAGFVDANVTGEAKGGVRTGLIPTLYGDKVIWTPEVNSTGTPAVRKVFYMQEMAIAMGIQRQPKVVVKDPPDLSKVFIADVLFGEAVIRENLAVIVNTKA